MPAVSNPESENQRADPNSWSQAASFALDSTIDPGKNQPGSKSSELANGCACLFLINNAPLDAPSSQPVLASSLSQERVLEIKCASFQVKIQPTDSRVFAIQWHGKCLDSPKDLLNVCLTRLFMCSSVIPQPR
jgi:hypothetical protein